MKPGEFEPYMDPQMGQWMMSDSHSYHFTDCPKHTSAPGSWDEPPDDCQCEEDCIHCQDEEILENTP